MTKMRLLMKKEGLSKYISHLDLMRTMRRAFSRAGIPLRHSEGFNPHPLMSFALPLSVCHESDCELLDFEPSISLDADALKRLCSSLPAGLEVLEVYDSFQKFGQLRWLEVCCTLRYDKGVPENAVSALEEHFSKPLVIKKRTKRGEAEIDILPMIHRISFEVPARDTLSVNAVISAQNPTLNPSGIADAISLADGFTPDFAEFRRLEVFDEGMNVFR